MSIHMRDVSVHFSVEAQARPTMKAEETSVTSSDLKVPLATSPVLDEPAEVGDPVVNRVASIILQPPAVASTHNISTPIFTHLGQQVHSVRHLMLAFTMT